MDPRAKNGEASAKNYKTSYQFDKVLGVKGSDFVVGSLTGEVRFFNSVGGNARKVVPSFNGQAVVSLDSSKDGSFLLVNCGKDLLLYPTFQGTQSAYSTIFKKDSKPAPVCLKVDPAFLKEFGVTENYFLTAKFDERRNQQENFIVATCENFIAVWRMADVLKGQFLTRRFARIEGSLIGGEFLYNNDNIIAAFKNKLVLKPNII